MARAGTGTDDEGTGLRMWTIFVMQGGDGMDTCPRVTL